MFFWSKKKKKHSPESNLPASAPEIMIVPEPAVVSEPENEEEPAVSPAQFWNSGASIEHWAGQMYQDELKKGTFDHLPGKGKPIEVPSGNITNSILKNANVLPEWLTIQHEIRDQLQHLLSGSHLSDEQVERELQEINQKIKKYNRLVPAIVLQKRKVNKEEMRQQYQQWV